MSVYTSQDWEVAVAENERLRAELHEKVHKNFQSTPHFLHQEKERLIDRKDQLQQMFDDVGNELVRVRKEMREVQTEIRLYVIDKQPYLGKGDPKRIRIDSLESRLDSVLVKYNTSCEKNLTLKQIESKLKKERISYDTRIKNLERGFRESKRKASEMHRGYLMSVKQRDGKFQKLQNTLRDNSHQSKSTQKTITQGKRKIRKRINETIRASKKLKGGTSLPSVRGAKESLLKKKKKEPIIIDNEKISASESENDLFIVSNQEEKEKIEKSDKLSVERIEENLEKFDQMWRSAKRVTGTNSVNRMTQKHMNLDNSHEFMRLELSALKNRLTEITEVRDHVRSECEKMKFHNVGIHQRSTLIEPFLKNRISNRSEEKMEVWEESLKIRMLDKMKVDLGVVFRSLSHGVKRLYWILLDNLKKEEISSEFEKEDDVFKCLQYVSKEVATFRDRFKLEDDNDPENRVGESREISKYNFRLENGDYSDEESEYYE